MPSEKVAVGIVRVACDAAARYGLTEDELLEAMALASDDLADRSGLVDIEALEDLLRTASWCDLSFWVDGDSAVVEFVPRSVPADVLPVSFDWGLAGSCKHLLIETDDAIEQVAAKVGYGDASNFRRASSLDGLCAAAVSRPPARGSLRRRTVRS